MILRLVETILIMYCALSYLACAYVLWHFRNKPEGIFDAQATTGMKVFAATVFIVFAPLVVADVIWERLTGPRVG
jgi:hypothetical protein